MPDEESDIFFSNIRLSLLVSGWVWNDIVRGTDRCIVRSTIRLLGYQVVDLSTYVEPLIGRPYQSVSTDKEKLSLFRGTDEVHSYINVALNLIYAAHIEEVADQLGINVLFGTQLFRELEHNTRLLGLRLPKNPVDWFDVIQDGVILLPDYQYAWFRDSLLGWLRMRPVMKCDVITGELIDNEGAYVYIDRQNISDVPQFCANVIPIKTRRQGFIRTVLKQWIFQPPRATSVMHEITRHGRTRSEQLQRKTYLIKQIKEEVAFRPGNVGYHACRENFADKCGITSNLV